MLLCFVLLVQFIGLFQWLFGCGQVGWYLVCYDVVVCFVGCGQLYQFDLVGVLVVQGFDLGVGVVFVVGFYVLVVGEVVVVLYQVEIVWVGYGEGVYYW